MKTHVTSDRARVGIAVAAVVLLLATTSADAGGSWTQWGGPNRDFVADSTGLAEQWPEAGPRELWSRDLGEGYSAILAEDDRLYTMYRADDQEVVICMNASDGKTIWSSPTTPFRPMGTSLGSVRGRERHR